MKSPPGPQVPVELTVGDVPSIPVTVVVPAVGAGTQASADIAVRFRATDGLAARPDTKTVCTPPLGCVV